MGCSTHGLLSTLHSTPKTALNHHTQTCVNACHKLPAFIYFMQGMGRTGPSTPHSAPKLRKPKPMAPSGGFYAADKGKPVQRTPVFI